MRKTIFVLPLACILAAGCSLTPEIPKQESNIHSTATQPFTESTPFFPSQGLISWEPIPYNSKQTTIYIKELHDTFAEVQYRIWRVADGPDYAKNEPNENYLIKRLYITPTMSMNQFIDEIQVKN